MARAHNANAMAGHLGAAVVAGYFVGEELPELDERVYSAFDVATGVRKTVVNPGESETMSSWDINSIWPLASRVLKMI